MPISNSFSHGGASLNRGALSESTSRDESTILGACTPRKLESYGGHVPDPKKIGPHGKSPLTIDRFTRCDRQRAELFCLQYGKGRRKERRDALGTMIELRESQPDPFTIAFLRQSWGDMSFMYISEIKDIARRVIRTPPRRGGGKQT